MHKFIKSQLSGYIKQLDSSLMSIHIILHKLNLGNLQIPKARSNSDAKMPSYNSIQIWSEILLDTKNKPCLTVFTAQYKKCVTLVLEALLLFLLLFLACIHQVILQRCYYENKFMRCCRCILIWFLLISLKLVALDSRI